MGRQESRLFVANRIVCSHFVLFDCRCEYISCLYRPLLSHSLFSYVSLCLGRVSKSPAFSELLYSATNIIVLMNDQIIRTACPSPLGVSHNVFEKPRVLITTLEYMQVFLEITALRTWGTRGKWLLIIVIQLVK